MSLYLLRFYSKKGQRGSALIILTMIIALILLPLVGLAIDGSVVFWMRTRLSSSVDAAAIAAARSISVGSTWSTQVASATTMADQYFAADFQPGIMGTAVTSTGGQPVVTIPTPTASLIQVTVNAQVSVPLYFLRMIGQNTVTIAATGQANRRVTNIILVLDRSYSMQEANACGTLVVAAQNFINFFVDGTDTVGLVTFQTTANEDFVANKTFKTSINTKLGTMICNGYTTTADGLGLAYQRIKTLNQPGALNVIVLFTDGIPDSVDATFPTKTQMDYRYGYDTNAVNAISYTNSPPAAPYNSLNNTSASGCGNGTYTGILTSSTGFPYAYGPTWGIFSNASIAINASNTYANGLIPAVVSSAGCTFSGTPSGTTYNSLAVRADIAYMPQYDVNNGGTNKLTGYKALDSCPSGIPVGHYYYGNNPPAWGCYRVDTPLSVQNAAWNAVDNLANTIRSDATYKPFIYTIGLGGTAFQAVDDTLLERIANDQRAPGYNASQNTGLYIYTTSGTLGTAFSQIASQVLHLAQ